MRHALLILVLLVGCQATSPASVAAESGVSTVAEVTEGLALVPGFVPIWWDAEAHRVLLELPQPGTEFLYWVSLPGGLGSNDVGLDRGQIGEQWLLQTLRSGNRVLLVAPNWNWRSDSEEAAVQTAVEEAFAKSVIYGFELKAESDGRLLVDATEFLLRDAHGIAGALARAGQGQFKLKGERSVLYGEDLLGFPKNSQIDALLTFASDSPGSEVRATASDASSVSMRVRHSFVALPEPGFEQRAFHPRSGFWAHSWNNLTAKLGEPLAVQSLVRHRLQKSDSTNPDSPAIEPIVYYIDRGAPEPIRTALLEGARYWQPVFAAAGFPDGFRAELLPEGADIHDVRYNIVQWANRSTRGWSYGNSVRDPRTGEILKGHVTLGALRVRQDMLLADGLLSPYGEGDDARSEEMALARIRQLSAHEIGHTLGLAHNFAASADGRTSVMDYPAPMIGIDGAGQLDLSNAYRNGCGEWDEFVIRYGYAEYEDAEAEAAGLRGALADAEILGLRYMSDRDSRGADRAHPVANLWDNGSDPVAYLLHEIEVRRIALANFNQNAMRSGRPMAELEEVLVPVYLHHRYQLEAAARAIGGVVYTYELNDLSRRGVKEVRAETQIAALAIVLSTLEPTFLALPDSIRQLIPPRAPGSSGNREIQDPGGLIFDPAELAAASIEISLSQLFDPARATRLVDQARRSSRLPSWSKVIEMVVELSALKQPAEYRSGHEALRSAVLQHLMKIAANESLPMRTREPANLALHGILEAIEADSLEADTLKRFFEDPSSVTSTFKIARVPPGSPIGCSAAW
ncbi:MAG: hypothetical protein ACI8TQ_000143 [Planctomycetota bacterium]|jgi:hypothetical protein